MRLRWPGRRDPLPVPAPGPDYAAIAVLENDLLGIAPAPGTAAALTVALRRTGTCLTHKPIDTTCFSDPRPTGVCEGCGRSMVRNDDGEWTIA